MKHKRRQFGLTLTELLVTVAIAAVLMAVAMPAAKRITESLRDSAGARALISAALSNARAIAVREGTYAGVRFQRAADGNTYMIFIKYDYDATGLANGFRVVDGRKPISLPEGVGVLDGFRVTRSYTATNAIQGTDDYVLADTDLLGNIGYRENSAFEDASTFSVVFSSSGRIATRLVQVWRRGANDTTFNYLNNIPEGMFLLDRYDNHFAPNFGIGPENSRTRFIIYSKEDLAAVNPAQRWTGYLGRLNPLMISPYTGELIGE